MSKEDLKAKLGQKNVMVIDVRLPDQIVPGTPKIRGAAVENPSEVLDWMHKYPKNKTLVIYCA